MFSLASRVFSSSLKEKIVGAHVRALLAEQRSVAAHDHFSSQEKQKQANPRIASRDESETVEIDEDVLSVGIFRVVKAATINVVFSLQDTTGAARGKQRQSERSRSTIPMLSRYKQQFCGHP